MGKKNYQQLLLKRIHMKFKEWQEKESISERELYNFLHSLKGTAGTIGLQELSEFCSSQLEIVAKDRDEMIPVVSLLNFKKRMMGLLEGSVRIGDYQVPEQYFQCFDEETVFLIIDDDLEFISFMKELLEKIGAQVVIALNGKRGIDQFYSMRPSFVFIDLYLPDMTGFHVLDQIAETARSKNTMLIMSSVDQSIENQILSYKKGAIDFVGKPIDLTIFLPYLFNREEMRKSIEKSIITDGLTGVGNRRHFDSVLHSLANMSDRTKVPFSLVLVDLDRFKKVNDQFGHPAGDEVLRKFCEIVNEEKRESDAIFRYGGEEFAFLLQGVRAEEATIFVNRVRERFNALQFDAEDNTFSCTFSAGIANYEGESVTLLSQADQALYEAKRTGRDQTILYNNGAKIEKRKLHILIVDDDTLIRSLLCEELEKWQPTDIDLSIKMYSSGPELLAEDWYSPDVNYVILLDGIMPEMDGLEVLGRVKRDKSQNNVIVSMMTARTGESDIKAALWLGADDYIMKPFKPEEVLSRVKKLATRF